MSTNRSICCITPTRDQPPFQAYINHRCIKPPAGSGDLYVFGIAGKSIDDAYNRLIEEALKTGASYLMTLEDDMLVPSFILGRLQARLLENSHLSAVSALYYTKGEDSYPLLLGDAIQDPNDYNYMMPPDALKPQLVEVNAIPMGCAMWRMDIFRKLTSPWFITTDEGSQDMNFCRRIAKLGERFAVDCSLRAQHLEISTGKIY